MEVTEGVSGLSGAGVVGIGTDLVDIDRFRAVLRRRPSVADRLFTAGERTYAGQAVDPAARLAARFAAKEATLKALGYGLGGMRMVDIEVVRDGGGRPGLVLHGNARFTAAGHGVGRWLVSPHRQSRPGDRRRSGRERESMKAPVGLESPGWPPPVA